MLYWTSNSDAEHKLNQLIEDGTITLELSLNNKALELFRKNNPVFCQFEGHIFRKHVKDHFKLDIKEMAFYGKSNTDLFYIPFLLLTYHVS